MLTEADHKRIADAITLAESKTSGEIFCVLTNEVSRYREIPLIWGAFAALALPPLAVLAGGLDLANIFGRWGDDNFSVLIHRAFNSYALIQAALFLAVVLVVAQPAIRRLMTPSFLKRHRVRQLARQHFVASGARLSDAHPHILIYASLKDRQVELVAHQAIHKAVGNGPWNASVAAVIAGMKQGNPAEGFVRAIEICGAALAANFPGDDQDKNRFSNNLLET